VVVGGGPAGLAAALMLAARGWSDITVVERSQELSVTDPDRCHPGPAGLAEGRALRTQNRSQQPGWTAGRMPTASRSWG
jgi:2-polyprenyl-6-methoxyphenol hydroxylase-like FAD-dependent oxidoreductase